METAVTIIHILVSVIIVIAVLLQSGKGASLGSSLGGSTSSQAIFGSAGPATFLTKITAGAAIIFMATSLFITYKTAHRGEESIMRDLPAVSAPAETEAPAAVTDETKAAPAPAAVVDTAKEAAKTEAVPAPKE